MKIYTSVCVFVRGMKMGDKKAQANCVVFDSFRHITMRFIVKQLWRAGGQLTPSNVKDFRLSNDD